MSTHITLTSIEGDKISFRRDVLTSASLLWDARLSKERTTEYGHEVVFNTHFKKDSLQAFHEIASIGRHGSMFKSFTMQTMYQSLGPVCTYGATGLLSIIMHHIQQHSDFESALNEWYLQNIIMYLDAHRIALPPIVHARLSKTICGNASNMMPYMWKIAINNGTQGFPVYRLRTACLCRIFSVHPHPSNMNPVLQCIRKRIGQRVLASHRARKSASL